MFQWRKLQQKSFLGQIISRTRIHNQDLFQKQTGVYVKVPVFSFAKLRRVDISLGPEMKSTGEVMGKDIYFEKALYKGLSSIWNENSKIWYCAY